MTGHGGAADVPARHRPAPRWDPAAARVRAALPPARDRLPRRRRRRPRVRRDDDRARLGGRRRRHPHATSVSWRGWCRSRRLPDGRYAVVAVGTRRIRVLAWLPDDPYPLADVDDWPDDEPDADGLAARVDATRERLGAVLELAVRTGDLREVPELTRQRRPAARLLPPRRAGADRPRRPLPAAQRAITGRAPRPARRGARRRRGDAAVPIGRRAAVIERRRDGPADRSTAAPPRPAGVVRRRRPARQDLRRAGDAGSRSREPAAGSAWASSGRCCSGSAWCSCCSACCA